MTQYPIPGDANSKIFNHALVKLCRNFDAVMIKTLQLTFLDTVYNFNLLIL